MAESVYRGGCFCGAIRFEVSGPLLYSAFCHCESCRRAAGAAYVPWATFGKEAFQLRKGELTTYRSSPGVRRGHCARCGTSLTYEHADRQGQIDVVFAAFDDPSEVEPVAHIFVEDKLDCVHLDDSLPRYLQNTGSPRA